MIPVKQLIAIAKDQQGTTEGRLAAMAAMKHELTKEHAIELGRLDWWIGADQKAVGHAQLHQAMLCCPFRTFHECMEALLDRPVFTHEFADNKRIQKEEEGKTVSDPFTMLHELVGDTPILVAKLPALGD